MGTGRKHERSDADAMGDCEAVFEAVDLGLALSTLEGRFLRVNQAMGRLLGRDPTELMRSSVEEVLRSAGFERETVAWQELVTGRRAQWVTSNRPINPDGQARWMELSITAVADEDGAPSSLAHVLQDVTKTRAAMARLTHGAMHDSLTGLANRGLFLDRLSHALARLNRCEHGVGLLFCDIDGFKLVNDSINHLAGDAVLVEVARRLVRTVRSDDTVCRMGGDEFVVLCESAAGWLEVERLAERVVAALQPPLHHDSQDVNVTVSVGVTFTDDPAVPPLTLLEQADSAMYVAKRQGRNRWTSYGRLREGDGQGVLVERGGAVPS